MTHETDTNESMKVAPEGLACAGCKSKIVDAGVSCLACQAPYHGTCYDAAGHCKLCNSAKQPLPLVIAGRRPPAPGRPALAIGLTLCALLLTSGALVLRFLTPCCGGCSRSVRPPAVADAHDASRRAEHLLKEAMFLEGKGSFDNALRHTRLAVPLLESIDGPGHPQVVRGLVVEARLLAAMGRKDEARIVVERGLAIMQRDDNRAAVSAMADASFLVDALRATIH